MKAHYMMILTVALAAFAFQSETPAAFHKAVLSAIDDVLLPNTQ